jgi:xylulose-5-phosphate/fructose-6-phosphate phosphoketolase
LVLAALRWTGREDEAAKALAAHCHERLSMHDRHVRETGTDMAEIAEWNWSEAWD